MTAKLSDFTALRKKCENNSRITQKVVDDFLLGFAARHQDLKKKMDQHFLKYRHVLSGLGGSETAMFKGQYIAHKIFRAGGLIAKFLKNPSLNRFTGEEREYLEQQAAVPWRFSFAELTGSPAKDFFMMNDAFTGEEYLLFSPSIFKSIAIGNKLLFFSLIGYNGSCWQTYGPIAEFQCFDPADIFFFATEKNPVIEDETEVQKDIEDDPVPYMMLISGSAYPRTFHKEDELIVMMSEYESQAPDTVGLKKKFISEYNDGVYRFTHKKLGTHPHFAQIYFNENNGTLLFHTMTESGFKLLVKDFNSLGYNIPDIPYLRVRLQMITTARSILKREIVINEYEQLFRKDPDPVGDDFSKKINKFLELVIPQINEGREPDIEDAARKTGLDPATGTDVVKIIRKQVKGAKGPDDVKVRKEPAKIKKAETVKKVPESPLLNTIFLEANLICNMEPWEDLRETDIFGVRMPGGQTWYISVMGRNGEFTAVAAYKGIEGLAGFYQIQDHAESIPETTILTIPHVLLSFNDREELDKEALEAVRKSGVTVRGKGRWPRFEEIIPGYFPAFPEQETLQELPVLLEQAIGVMFDAVRKPGMLRKKGENGDKILIRVPSGDPAKPRWKSHYEIPEKEGSGTIYKPTCDLSTSGAVSKLKLSRDTIQTDLFLIPAPVKEKAKRGYFPFMLLILDKSSGTIAGTNLLRPDPDLQSVYESFPQKLLEEILKLGYRPQAVEFRSEFLIGLAKNFLLQSGCTPVLVDQMPQMEEAISSLMENLSRR